MYNGEVKVESEVFDVKKSEFKVRTNLAVVIFTIGLALALVFNIAYFIDRTIQYPKIEMNRKADIGDVVFTVQQTSDENANPVSGMEEYKITVTTTKDEKKGNVSTISDEDIAKVASFTKIVIKDSDPDGISFTRPDNNGSKRITFKVTQDLKEGETRTRIAEGKLRCSLSNLIVYLVFLAVYCFYFFGCRPYKYVIEDKVLISKHRLWKDKRLELMSSELICDPVARLADLVTRPHAIEIYDARKKRHKYFPYDVIDFVGAVVGSNRRIHCTVKAYTDIHRSIEKRERKERNRNERRRRREENADSGNRKRRA